MSAGTGPYLTIAAFCERVLQERDGVISMIRIFDRWTVQGAFQHLPPTIIPLSVMIAFKYGSHRSQVRASLRLFSPSRVEMQRFDLPTPEIQIGEDAGANIIVNLSFGAEEEGVFWFEVFLNDQMVTKMPLNVVYLRTGVAETQQPQRTPS